MIKCGECGSWYGSKVLHSTDKYRKVIYRCNHKFDGVRKCRTPHLTDGEIKQRFVQAANELLYEKEELLQNTKAMVDKVCDTTELEEDQQTVLKEMNVLVVRTQDIITKNSRVAQDEDEYQKTYDDLMEKYRKSKAEYDRVTEQISGKQAQRERFKGFLATMENQKDFIAEFDEGLWSNLMSHITINGKDDIRFTFKNRFEIRV